MSKAILFGGLFVVVLSCVGEAPEEFIEPRGSMMSIQAIDNWYVAPPPLGSASNPGTQAQPWTLKHALGSAGGAIGPGDTVWMLNGNYIPLDPSVEKFKATLSGGVNLPVVFRQYPGHRATLQDNSGNGCPSKSLLSVTGSWLVFWGFELTNPNTTRETSTSCSEWRPHGIYNVGNNNTYFNLIIHDVGTAIYSEATATNIEIYGNIIFNNGWQGPTNGAGHGIYVRSNVGPVLIKRNIVFNHFGYGLHVFPDPGTNVRNVMIWGNTVFNSGTLATNSTARNIVLGGYDFATGDSVHFNRTYYPPGVGATNVQLGYGTLRNGTLDILGNYFVGGTPVLNIGYWGTNQGDLSHEGLTLIGSNKLIKISDAATNLPYDWCCGTYWRDPTTLSWQHAGTSYNWGNWQQSTGLFGDNPPTSGTPEPQLDGGSFYWHGQYRGGGDIIFYNWANKSSVTVNWFCTMTLPQGTGQYRVYNVQNLNTPVLTGTCNSNSVQVPISAQNPPTPIGWSPGPSTGTAFSVFIVRSP